MPFSHQNHLRYIAIEGADGSGKSTQVRKLVEALTTNLQLPPCRDNTPNVVAAHQPTHGPIGALIRQILRGQDPIDDAALQLMFAADRMSATPDLRRMLEDGHHVITDRCELSSAVYYAASVPQFKCALCGWVGDASEAKRSPNVRRWSYDDHFRQKQLITVNAWRHSEACDIDLTDVGEQRFHQALSWNDEAIHPGLIIVLVGNPLMMKERLNARGTFLDMLENEIIQERASRIYDWATKAHAKIRAFTDVVGVPAWGEEEGVAQRVLRHAWQYIDGLNDEDDLHSKLTRR
jgi:thymidylate kinase